MYIKCKYLGRTSLNTRGAINVSSKGPIKYNETFIIPEDHLIALFDVLQDQNREHEIKIIQTTEEIARKANYISIIAGIISLGSFIFSIYTYLHQ